MSDPFIPTHIIPPGGLDVWTTPDPAEPCSAHLEPGVQVAVREQRGDWAAIVCDNGFSGWLGVTTLQPVALVGAAAGPSPATGQAAVLPGMPAAGYYAQVYQLAERGPTASPASLVLAEGANAEAKPASVTAIGVGTALAIIGCFLPWFSVLETGITGYEIPLQFLFLKDSLGGADGGISTTGPTVGLVCLLAAVIGLVCSRRPSTDKFRRLGGWLIVLLPTMTVGQVQLVLNDDKLTGGFGASTSLFSTLGIGLFVTVVGGLVLALSPRATKAPTLDTTPEPTAPPVEPTAHLPGDVS